MSCTVPLTLSPGFLFLDYVHSTAGLSHRTHARMRLGEDPLDDAFWSLEATYWANLMSAVVSSKIRIDGWGAQDLTGRVLYQFAFGSAFLGSHAVAAGALDYRSRTLTVTGRGKPASPGVCSGEARTVIFVADSYEYTAGTKKLVAGTDPAVDALVAGLQDAGHPFWCDYYGQKAGARPDAPIQFNARVQRKYGT